MAVLLWLPRWECYGVAYFWRRVLELHIMSTRACRMDVLREGGRKGHLLIFY